MKIPETNSQTNGSAEERLFWLASQLSNKQREVLKACIGIATDNGRIEAGEYPSVYQRVAEITGRSPGFTNTGINELIWLGLLRHGKTRCFKQDGGYNRDRYEIVGWPYYATWPVNQFLQAEPVRGKSHIVKCPEWQQSLNAIQQEVCHDA